LLLINISLRYCFKKISFNFLKMSENEKIQDAVSEIIKEEMLLTSGVGIPNIFRNTNLFIRIPWIILWLASTGVTIYVMTQNVSDFLQYDVTTKTRSISQSSINFPTVTICNLDPFITTASFKFLANLIKNKYTDEQIEYVKDFYENSTDEALVNGFITWPFDDLEPSALYAAFMSDDATKKSYGYNFSEFVLSCNYASKKCLNNTDFLWNYNHKYGNCWSFNSNKTKPIFESKIPGNNDPVLNIFQKNM
jgi:hypothetical protein